MNSTRQFLTVIVIVLGLAGILAWSIPGTSFSANVVDLLPGQQTEVRILREIADKEQGRQITAILSSSDEKTTTKAIKAFRETLLRSTTVDHVWLAESRAFEEAGRVLFDNRYEWLLPNWMKENFPDWRKDSPGALAIAGKVADNLDHTLQSPEGFAMESTIPADPFLLLGQLSGIDSLAPEKQPENETSFWIQQSQSPFVEAGQEQLFAALESALTAARQEQANLDLEYTGVAVFAHASKEEIKSEIQRLNLMGLVFILAISIFVLRRFHDVARIGLVLAGSLATATAAVIACFGSVHIIALVIGSILAGVAVDYAFHLILIEKTGLPRRAVTRAVITGSVSSALGFIVLLWAPLPFLNQVGVFVGSGLVAALLLSLILRPEDASRELSGRWRLKPFAQPRWTAPLVIILSIPGLFTLQFRDKISDLEYPLPELEERDQRIRASASSLDGKELLLAHGEDILAARKALARFTDSVDGLHAVHAGRWIPTLEESRATHAFFQEYALFGDILIRELEDRGYIREAFMPFLSAWENYIEKPPGESAYVEGIREFANTLPGPLGNFIHIGNDIAWFGAIIPKEAEVSGNGLVKLDQEQMLSESFSRYRQQVILFAGLCVAGIVAGLIFVYGPSAGITSFILPVLALSAAFGISSFIHGGIGLFQVVGGLLAFCISLDYVIFAVQSNRHQTRTPASVGISAVTTLGVFGILATSRIPGVQQLALTVILCIGFSLLFIICGWPVFRDKRDPYAGVLDKLPHGKEARFIRQILECEERNVRVQGRSDASSDLPAECLIEAMAQAAAAWMAVVQGEAAVKRSGMLVLVQKCSITDPVLPARTSFICEVESQSDIREGFLMFDGRTVSEDGMEYIRATFSIFIPPTGEQG